jgi:hypothetical protein
MKKFAGFKFSDVNISLLSNLNHINTVESYDFYKNGNIYIHDPNNNRLLLVKAWKRQTAKNFYNDLITAYNIAYNIRWTGPIANKQKLTVEDAKFIFEQSEKVLKDSIETSGTIVIRVNTIIAIIVAVIVGLTSYVVSEWKKSCSFDNVLITSSIGLFYFYVLGFFAVRSIYPSTYFTIGSSPKDLFSDSFFLEVVPHKSRIIRYYVSEIENYQFRVERNNYLNGKRWALYKRTLWALLAAPIVFFLTYCILTIFHS